MVDHLSAAILMTAVAGGGGVDPVSAGDRIPIVGPAMSAAGGAMTKGGAVVPGFDCVMDDAYLPFQWPKEAGRHEFILETPPHWDGLEDFVCRHVIRTTHQAGPWRIDRWTVASEGLYSGEDRGITQVVLHEGVPILWGGDYAMNAALTRKIGGEASLHVVTSGHSGGNGCCEQLEVWQLSPGPVRRVYETTLTVGGGYTDLEPYIADSWRVPESAFIHILCHRMHPRPDVVVRFEDVDGVTVASVDAAAMRIPKPPKIMMAVLRRRAFSDLLSQFISFDKYDRRYLEERGLHVFVNAPPQAVVQPMLTLLYGGHPDLAWQFFDDVWPESWPLREVFAAELQQCLDRSQYFSDLPWAAITRPNG